MLEQIRVIDKARLLKYVGKLSTRQMIIIEKKILISFGINASINDLNHHKKNHN